VHGGAWAVPSAWEDPAFGAAAAAGLRAALEAGAAILTARGAALDAVEAALCALEDCPVLNAGRGAVCNADGEVELDAALMEGTTRRAGAVAGVRCIAHPTAAARAVLRDGRHVLLAGAGAERFAREAGIPRVEPAVLSAAARRPALGARGGAGDTVGAVARDARGGLAAGTSTGGTPGKRAGRISDSALIGAGTWADDATCAVSATGEGEYFIRMAFARDVDARVRYARRDLASACAEALAEIRALSGSGGCIAVDRAGRTALPFNTRGMLRGVIRADAPPRVAVHPEQTLEE